MFTISQGISVLITTLGALSMVVGFSLQYVSGTLKLHLAYLSISQMGYVILSTGIGMMLSRKRDKE
jgi:formate hydrogenlyase subunit 3/multisubunit Na+/H+ antiporter MnhD subunit